jgi:hypothetical protein
MTTQTTPAETRPHAYRHATSRLLTCGIAAGLQFTLVSAAQVLGRSGFDLSRHPISLLANGDLGWIQVGNFLTTGVLLIAFALGARRVLSGSRGGTWGPRLIGAFGAGMIIAGAFVADPENGFPTGTPDGPPMEISWRGIVHGAGAAVAFDGLIVGCFVLARRFATVHDRRWTVVSLATAVVLIALLANPGASWLSIRMAVGAVVALAYVALLAVRLQHELYVRTVWVE